MDNSDHQAKLQAEKDKLLAELKSFAILGRGGKDDWDAVKEEDPGAVATMDEVAEEMEGMNERKAAEVTLETRLQKIDSALDKITAGRYGLCEVGGESIEEERLAADPAARTCKQHLDREDNLPL